MADEEAPLIKQAAAPAKASSSWRLVVVALVLGLVAGYVVRGAVMNETTPLELRSGGHPAPGSGSGSGEEVMYFFASGADPKYSAHGHGHKVDTEPEDGTEYTFGHHFAADQ